MRNSIVIIYKLLLFNEDSQYQDIATKFSKNLSELDDIIEEMRMYNNNSKNYPLIHIFK